MRRSEKAITSRREIDELLNAAVVCRLALCDGGEPYIVPMCFGYDGSRLYFHGAAEGRRMDILAGNRRVCFEVDSPGGIVPGGVGCAWSMRYTSVIGHGRVEFLSDPAQRVAALDAIMSHYGGPAGGYAPAMLERTVVFCVVIESISGKRSL